MEQQAEQPGILLEELVRLTERAADTIEQLQRENAALAAQLEQTVTRLASAGAETAALIRRVQDLEAAQQGLARDAHWCRWFRGKYAESTFYMHIQAAYLAEFPAPGVAAARPDEVAV